MCHQFTIAVLLLLVCPLASAQYIWVDNRGVKQLSDRPPPPDIPIKRILKAPGKPAFNPYAPVELEPRAEQGPAQPSLAERNADFSKRQREVADQARLDADEAERKAANNANCQAARQNQQALNQGLRLSSIDKNGERGYMDEAQREELRKNTQKVLVDCK